VGGIRCGNGVARRGSCPACFREREDHIDDASLW
jgi:hypothetical protein